MNVIVTGGSGFIGKYVCEALSKRQISIYNWDLKEGTDLFKEDTVHGKGFYSSIIHLVAQLEILGVDPIKELRNNVESTLHMLEFARKLDIPKFVFTSTADVYGEPLTDYGEDHDEVRPCVETQPLKPFWSYAASKVAAEAYVQQYEELYGIKTVIIRPSIVTGVGEWYGRFITLSIARLRENEPILIFGNGQQTRDFVPVKYVAEIITEATIKNIKTPEIYNAGTGYSPSIYQMALQLYSIIDKYPKIEYINPNVGEMGRKPHEQINQALSMAHTHELVKPVHSQYIWEVLKEEIEWIQKMDGKQYKKWKENPRY